MLCTISLPQHKEHFPIYVAAMTSLKITPNSAISFFFDSRSVGVGRYLWKFSSSLQTVGSWWLQGMDAAVKLAGCGTSEAGVTPPPPPLDGRMKALCSLKCFRALEGGRPDSEAPRRWLCAHLPAPLFPLRPAEGSPAPSAQRPWRPFSSRPRGARGRRRPWRPLAGPEGAKGAGDTQGGAPRARPAGFCPTNWWGRPQRLSPVSHRGRFHHSFPFLRGSGQGAGWKCCSAKCLLPCGKYRNSCNTQRWSSPTNKTSSFFFFFF